MKPQLSETARPLEETADDGRARPGQAGGRRPSVRGALELVALVIAPTTLLTALAFYFGWRFTNARARYFGIDPSTLGFGTSDYVLRSVDALFVPVAVVAAACLSLVAVHTVVTRLPDPRVHRLTSYVVFGVGTLGLALLAVGVVAMFESLPETHYLFPPMSTGVGAALVGYALFVARGGFSTATAVALASFLVLSAFWTASTYADALGRGRAEDLVASLERQPRVIIYATKRLQLPDQVAETRLDPRDSAYAFRYSGLRLLIRSGGNYFLLTEGWTQEDGVTILLRDGDDLRFEFRPGE